MTKYKKNLKVENDFVISYGIEVAKINHDTKTVEVLDYFSQTTSKHINYVASELGYSVVK